MNFARTWFGWPGAAALLASAATAALITFQLKEEQETQADRNVFLQREIAKLDRETEEVRNLHDYIADFLGRKNVIEALQKDRPQPVWLLDELPRLRPQGVYLTSVKLEQSRVEVAGFASSQKAVDEFVGSIAASSRLASPKVVDAPPGKAPLTAFPIGFGLKAEMRAEPSGQAR